MSSTAFIIGLDGARSAQLNGFRSRGHWWEWLSASWIHALQKVWEQVAAVTGARKGNLGDEMRSALVHGPS